MKRIIIVVAILTMALGLLFFATNKHSDATNPADSIHEASAETGDIPEKVLGDPNQAEVILFEYADYACSHCAEWNKVLKNLIAESDDKLTIVFRYYDLGMKNDSGFKPSATVAAAATAAQLQGYWEAYKDLLFSNQAEWFYASKENLNDLLIDYFKTVSNGKGNLAKFKTDMQSEAVAKRNQFENQMGKKVNLQGTPLFRLNGKEIDPLNLLSTIKQKLQN